MMLKVAMIEYFTDLIKSLRWWKLVLFLLLTVALVFAYASDEYFIFWQLYIPIWISTTIRPKVSKLNYLLPGDKSSRSRYLMGAYVGILIFFLIWYGIINGINLIFQNYDLEYGFKKLLGQDIIIILYVAAASTLTSYIDKSGYRKENKKSGMIRQVLMLLLLLYPGVHIAVLNRFLTGNWYLVSVVISYLCAISASYLLLSTAKNIDTSYENIRKPVKVFI